MRRMIGKIMRRIFYFARCVARSLLLVKRIAPSLV